MFLNSTLVTHHKSLEVFSIPVQPTLGSSTKPSTSDKVSRSNILTMIVPLQVPRNSPKKLPFNSVQELLPVIS